MSEKRFEYQGHHLTVLELAQLVLPKSPGEVVPVVASSPVASHAAVPIVTKDKPTTRAKRLSVLPKSLGEVVPVVASSPVASHATVKIVTKVKPLTRDKRLPILWRAAVTRGLAICPDGHRQVRKGDCRYCESSCVVAGLR